MRRFQKPRHRRVRPRGAELNYPAKAHKQAFQLILDNNVNCTAHAGEAYGPESDCQAIHYCGAHRIGHGTACAKRRSAQLRLRSPHSARGLHQLKHQTGAADSFETHPLPFITPTGCAARSTPTTGSSPATVSRELLLPPALRLYARDLKDSIVAGFKAHFAPTAKKATN